MHVAAAGARRRDRPAQGAVAQGAAARRRAQDHDVRARQGAAHAAAHDVALAVGGRRRRQAHRGGEEHPRLPRHADRADADRRQVPHGGGGGRGQPALPGGGRQRRRRGEAPHRAAARQRRPRHLHAAQPAASRCRPRLPADRGRHPDAAAAQVRRQVPAGLQAGLPQVAHRARPRRGLALLQVARPRLRHDRRRPGQPQGRAHRRLPRRAPLAAAGAGGHQAADDAARGVRGAAGRRAEAAAGGRRAGDEPARQAQADRGVAAEGRGGGRAGGARPARRRLRRARGGRARPTPTRRRRRR